MTTPSNASPTAVAHRDAVISAYNNYKYSRDSKDPSDVPFLLSLAAKYSKAIVEDKDDKVEIVVGPVDIDYTMGGCDGPNAASGVDTVHF